MDREDVNALKRFDRVGFSSPFGSIVYGLVVSVEHDPGDYQNIVVQWESGWTGRIGWPDSHRLIKA